MCDVFRHYSRVVSYNDYLYTNIPRVFKQYKAEGITIKGKCRTPRQHGNYISVNRSPTTYYHYPSFPFVLMTSFLCYICNDVEKEVFGSA